MTAAHSSFFFHSWKLGLWASLRGVLLLSALGLVHNATANATGEVVRLPVPEHTIYPGERLTLEMLAVRDFRNRGAQLSRYAKRANDVVGQMARRTLVARRPIPLAALRAPHTVRRGSRVQVFFRTGALQVSGFADSLVDGSVGERIPLRNPNTRVIIHGVVQPNGTIEVQ